MNDIRVLEIPKWGLSMEEGTINIWLIEEGDSFCRGQEICEIETSKIVNSMEAPFDGVLRRIIVKTGEVLPVGSPIAVASKGEVSDAEIDNFISTINDRAKGSPAGLFLEKQAQKERATLAANALAVESGVQEIPASFQVRRDDSDVLATPSARRLARELGINLHDCRSTGSRGRVCRADVEAAKKLLSGTTDDTDLSAKVAKTYIAESQVDELPMTGMRRTVAARLQESKRNSPHFRLVIDLELDSMLAVRKQICNASPNIKISVNDFVVKACAMALTKVPNVNVQFDEATMTVRRFADADISLAVALENGLITPIVKGANRKSLSDIASEVHDLKARAKAGTLRPEEFLGGTFSVSNLGMYGVKQFDAIINPPQSAILAVGAAEQRIVVRNGEPVVKKVMTVSLSCDHRVIDGALGARFLAALKNFIENPELMIA